MNTLLTSPLAERLGWVLLHSLWQITAIALALIVSRWFFRSPQARHLLAMIALVACVAWPAADLWLAGKAEPRMPAQLLSPSDEAAVGDSEALGSSTIDHRADTSAEGAPNRTYRPHATYTPYMAHLLALTQSRRALPTLAAAWLIGVIVLTLRHAGALWWLHRLRTRDTQPAPDAILGLARSIGTRLGLRRGFRVLVSARAFAPMVIGTLRPVVLLPASVLTGFSTDQIEALLAHELAHLRRWDDVLNLLQCAIETLLFFQPAVWWISRRAREDRELCADDLATARGIERHTLAQALGRLALDTSPDLALAATGNMPVLARISRLLLPPPAPMRLNAWPLITLLVLASSFIIQPRAKAEAPPRGRILDRNGVVLAESPTLGERRYPKQTLAAHVLGYTALKKPGDRDLSGRSGIELSQDATLAAKQDVQLTLDADIQTLAETALLKHARNGGAAVVIDPNTGDILALASSPTFDPNEFVPSISIERFDALAKDSKHPLMPRAVQGTYFPGSTFKLVTALAGLKSGAIDEKTIFDGAPDFKIGDRTFHNWNKVPEGPIDLVAAIKRSANTWFYQAALKTGSDPITSMASDLGFGQPTGLPLQENKGFLPTDAYYQQTAGHKLLPGTLASISIGQVITATPLQVALATAAIGNGGKVLIPRLIKGKLPPQVRTDLLAKGVKPEHLDLVKRGMIAVVQGDGGTGHTAIIEGTTVAGKTGTAQWVVGENRDKSKWLAWFTGFAPANNPKLVVAVVYEGSFGEAVSGGAVAAPIAQEIMKGALEKLKPVSWIDVLDQQWLETASRLSVPADPGTTILYHPNAQNLSAGPIRATDIALIDAKNPTSVQFFHGDGRITVGKDGKATIDADEATFVTSLDVLPEHWQRAVKGQPKKPSPPPAWIDADWLQTAKSTTVPFKVTPKNPLRDPPGPAFVFYNGTATRHEKPDGEVATAFTGDVVVVIGEMLISGRKTTIIVSTTGKISSHVNVGFRFVKSGDLPALDGAIKTLRHDTNMPAPRGKGSASADTKTSRTYPNPWPLDSSRPADIIVSSDGRSYDYVPGRGSSLRVAQEHRSTVQLQFEPQLWEPQIKPAYRAGNPVASDLLHLVDPTAWPALSPINTTEPRLLPSWEKFHAKELPKPPDTIDDLLSEPMAPKLE